MHGITKLKVAVKNVRSRTVALQRFRLDLITFIIK